MIKNSDFMFKSTNPDVIFFLCFFIGKLNDICFLTVFAVRRVAEAAAVAGQPGVVGECCRLVNTFIR
jgi:hypothetical protein